MTESDFRLDALLDEIGRKVQDQRVLAAMAAVSRPLFVPEAARAEAWADRALPIAEQQTISQPSLVARMCALLELEGHETVLDVGTGSGYHAAVLSHLAARVISLERNPRLSAAAAKALEAAGIRNVILVVGDGARGYPLAAPYAAINVAAASGTHAEAALSRQLADGGRLVLPVAGPAQRLVRVRRRGLEVSREELEEVSFVPLISDH